MDASRGLTIVEGLVLLVIAILLASILLPALSGRRESARRQQCEQRLQGLMRAIAKHVEQHGMWPAGVLNPGGPIRNLPVGEHQSWIVQLVPFQTDFQLPASFDPTISVYAKTNDATRRQRIEWVVCPSSVELQKRDYPASHYAGVHHDQERPIDVDQNGSLFLNSNLLGEDFPDGLAATLMLGEKTVAGRDLGWMSGTRATLRNMGSPINQPQPPSVDEETYVGGFGSEHLRGANFAYGDGRIEFLDQSIDATVYRRLGHRADRLPAVE